MQPINARIIRGRFNTFPAFPAWIDKHKEKGGRAANGMTKNNP
jgi:hypothetical protein